MLWIIKVILITSLYESDVTKITICYLNKFVKIVMSLVLIMTNFFFFLEKTCS